MKRIALVAGLVLVAAALAGVLRPEGASAVDPAPNADTVTVSGAGVVTAVPDRAQISAGVESRAATARAALQANAAAMEKVLDALRARGGQNVTTQTVSLSTAFDEQGQPKRVRRLERGVRRDEPDRSGSTDRRSGRRGREPGLRPVPLALRCGRAVPRRAGQGRRRRERARGDPREGGRPGARSCHRDGRVRGFGPAHVREGRGGARLATPIVSGTQETTATVSVTYELR